MTPSEIDELDRLMTAATPGPWLLTGDSTLVNVTHTTRDVWTFPRTEADMVYLGGLLNAAPALIAAAREVERLRAFVPRWVDSTVTRPNDPAWVTPMRVYDLKVGTSSLFAGTIVVHTDGAAYEGAGERHPNIESAARAVCARLGIPYVPVEVSDG